MTLDTSGVAEPGQFDAWAQHSRNTHLRPLHPGGFLARGSFWDLGPVHVADTWLDPFVSDRDQALVNRTAVDYVQLVALAEGTVHFETDDLDQHCAAPDMFLRDYARPSRATTSRIHAVTVYLARSFLEEAAGPLAVHGTLPVSPEQAVLRHGLQAIVRELPSSSANSAGLYARTLRDLLAATVLRSQQQDATLRDKDGLARMKAWIARQPPGSISVEQLMARFGVSRSVLYQMFRGHGGVLAYDRLRRLRALHRDLCDTTRSVPIAELAAVHGFLDKTSLTRSFRTAFGCPPSEARRRGVPPAPGAARAVASAVRTAVERLG